MMKIAFLFGLLATVLGKKSPESTSASPSLPGATCVRDDDCQQQTSECFSGVCLCQPGFFTTNDGSCVSTCSLLDLEIVFVAYGDSNIRGENTLGTSHEPTVQQCMDRCLLNGACLTFDYRASDGWCQLHNVTALTAPSRWVPRIRPHWVHYQRMCRSSEVRNTSCSSDDDCTNGQCVSGRCQCAPGFFFAQKQSSCILVDSCVAVQKLGGATGVYTIFINDRTSTLTVWCDMDSSDGGWLVFQRRRDGSVNFHRNWMDYINGFGDVTGEFWLGLSKVHSLTKQKTHRLRVDLGEVNGHRHFAEYSSFRVDGPQKDYKLHVSGYSGTAGDGLFYYDSQEFVPYGDTPHTCAPKHNSGWWHDDCHISNLNGRYKADGAEGADGVNWYETHKDLRSFTFSEMKLKHHVVSF